MKESSSSGLFKTIYANSSNLILFGKKKHQIFEILK